MPLVDAMLHKTHTFLPREKVAENVIYAETKWTYPLLKVNVVGEKVV